MQCSCRVLCRVSVQALCGVLCRVLCSVRAVFCVGFLCRLFAVFCVGFYAVYGQCSCRVLNASMYSLCIVCV